MVRKHVLLLDELHSPMFSPLPVSGTLPSGIPKSALAERIFNDPHAWDFDHDAIANPSDIQEELTWFEIEAESSRFLSSPVRLPELQNGRTLPGDDDSPFRTGSSNQGPLVQDMHRETQKANKIPVEYGNTSLDALDPQQRWAAIHSQESDDDKSRPILLDLSRSGNGSADFNMEFDLHFGPIVGNVGVDGFEKSTDLLGEPIVGPPRPGLLDIFSPDTSSEDSESSNSDSSRDFDYPASLETPNEPMLRVPPFSGVLPAQASVVSPVKVYSASTTMSFLEWHGIYPDTPLGNRSNVLSKSPLSHTIAVHPAYGHAKNIATNHHDTPSSIPISFYDNPKPSTIISADARIPPSGPIAVPSNKFSSLPSPVQKTCPLESSLKRMGMINTNTRSATYMRSSAGQVLTESPVPVPTIPLPDPPLGLPASDTNNADSVNSTIGKMGHVRMASAESISRSKSTPTRRLPSVPTSQPVRPDTPSRCITPLMSSKLRSASPSLVNTPPPRMGHPYGSNFSTAPAQNFSPFNASHTPNLSTMSSCVRSPPGPAGPRRRNPSTPLGRTSYAQSITSAKGSTKTPAVVSPEQEEIVVSASRPPNLKLGVHA